MKPNRKSLLLAVISLTLTAQSASAADLYWDTNGTGTAGSGAATGTWGTSVFWSTDPTGANVGSPVLTAATTALDDLFFSAGTNGTSGTVTLTTTQNAKSLTFEEATTTISGTGGIITLGGTGGNITVNSGASGIIGNNTTTKIGGSVGLTKLGTGTITLNGSEVNTFTGGLNVNSGTLALNYSNLASAAELINSGNALSLGGGALSITGNATTNTVQTFAGTTFGAGANILNLSRGGSTNATLNLGALTINAGSITQINASTFWTNSTNSTTERVFITSYNGTAVGTYSFLGAGVLTHTSALNGSARWVGVNTNGQLTAMPMNATTVTATSIVSATTPYTYSSTTGIALTNTSATGYGLQLSTATASTLTLANSGTLTLNAINQINTATATIAPGTGTSNLIIGSERNLVINVDNTGGTTISAPIANNGSTGGAGGTASRVTIGSTILSGNPGTVTFSGVNTFTGQLSVVNSTLSIATINNVSANGVLGNSASSVILGSAGQTGTLAYTAATGTSTKPFTMATGGTGAFDVTTALTLSGVINGSGALTKAGAGNLTLTGTNTYNGLTTITAGTLQLGDGTSGNDGTIANTSGVTNNGTLTFNRFGTSNASYSIGGTGGVTKLGAGTQTLSGLSATAANNYSGTTTLGGGTLAFASTNPSFSGGLIIGESNTSANVSTLDLNNASATFAGAMTVQTNSSTANTIAIGAGQTLTLSGNVTIGSGAGSNTTTKLEVSGLGAFNVANSAASGSFIVGGTSPASGVGNIADADFSGLAIMDVNLSGANSLIRVHPNIATGTTNVGNRDATLRLAATSSLTAATLTVGGGPTNNSSSGQRNELYLGSASTIIKADTVNVGTGSRDGGYIGGGGGTLTITDKAGTGRAAFNIASSNANTGTSVQGGNVVDLASVNADLLLSTLTIGGQNRNADRTDTFTFSLGSLDATNVIVGDNGGAANATASDNNWTSNLNIGGGTTTIGTGGLEIARGDTAVTGTDTLSGNVNISGGTVSIANNTSFGAAVRLGENTIATGLTTNGTLNITGGTVTLAGDIIKGASTGATSAALIVNGASAILDMGGNDITSLTGITYTDGTIKNLGIVNTGMTLAGTGSRVFDQGVGVSGDIQGAITGSDIGPTKQGLGSLTLSGNNTYNGATLVSGGSLVINGNISTSVLTTVASGATLGGNGTVGAATISGILAPGNSIGTITATGDVTWNSNNSWVFELGTAAASLALADSGGSTQDLLSITGGSSDFLKGTGSSFTFDFANGGELGYYKLVEWAGSTDFADGDFLATNLASGLTGTFTVDSGTSALYLNVNAIPEPSAALLGALGAMLLLRRRR